MQLSETVKHTVGRARAMCGRGLRVIGAHKRHDCHLQTGRYDVYPEKAIKFNPSWKSYPGVML